MEINKRLVENEDLKKSIIELCYQPTLSQELQDKLKIEEE